MIRYLQNDTRIGFYLRILMFSLVLITVSLFHCSKPIKGEFNQKHNLFRTDSIFWNWNYMFRPLLAIFRFL